jgi:hypothetical protein
VGARRPLALERLPCSKAIKSIASVKGRC